MKLRVHWPRQERVVLAFLKARHKWQRVTGTNVASDSRSNDVSSHDGVAQVFKFGVVDGEEAAEIDGL